MIIFKTEASAEIGFGHIQRSSYLAGLLKAKIPVRFMINKNKQAADFLQAKNFQLTSIPQIKESAGLITLLVFDIRHIHQEDLQLAAYAAQHSIPTVQITDLGLSPLPVTAQIDGSIRPALPKTEDSAVRFLSGPDYAILHHRCRHFHQVRRKYKKQIKNVFICLGGGAQYRNLRNIIDVLSRQQFQIKVAAGFSLKKSYKKILRRLYPKLSFVGKTESLARAFFEADVSVVACGIAAYEAACVGTPAIYLYYHQEQQCIAETMTELGLGLCAGNIRQVKQLDVAPLFSRLNWQTRSAMGEQGKKLFDGMGAYRIVDFFLKTGIINSKWNQ
jgi:spore coat polysaccharide biosynthesis predicted glycosyltransferase SpsG